MRGNNATVYAARHRDTVSNRRTVNAHQFTIDPNRVTIDQIAGVGHGECDIRRRTTKAACLIDRRGCDNC